MLTVFKKITRPYRFVFGNLYCLFFLNGFLLASIFYFASESNYERQLFNVISANIKSTLPQGYDRDSFAIKAMFMAHELQSKRQDVFNTGKLSGFKAAVMHPATVDLMTADGACGSYATVLARILKANDYEVRIAQMSVDHVRGGHIVVEAKANKGWIALDALDNQYFVKPDGELASIDDVSSNWDYYKQQTSARYPQLYTYKNIRYTNWNKIPVIMPAMKAVLNWTMGKEEADKVSLRPYFLRIYNFAAVLMGILYVIVMIITFKKIFAKKNVSLKWKHILGTKNQPQASPIHSS